MGLEDLLAFRRKGKPRVFHQLHRCSLPVGSVPLLVTTSCLSQLTSCGFTEGTQARDCDSACFILLHIHLPSLSSLNFSTEQFVWGSNQNRVERLGNDLGNTGIRWISVWTVERETLSPILLSRSSNDGAVPPQPISSPKKMAAFPL